MENQEPSWEADWVPNIGAGIQPEPVESQLSPSDEPQLQPMPSPPNTLGSQETKTFTKPRAINSGTGSSFPDPGIGSMEAEPR